MRTAAPVSSEAMKNLSSWVPAHERELAWGRAYAAFLATSPTTDGSERAYASEKADRFWPNYLTDPETYGKPEKKWLKDSPRSRRP